MKFVRPKIYIDHARPKQRFYVDFSIGGKRKKKRFSTKSEAYEYLAKFNASIGQTGVESLFFSQADKDELECCRELLQTRGVSVLDAVKQWCFEHPELGFMRLGDAFNDFIIFKQKLKRRNTTIKDLRQRVGTFVKFCGDVTVGELRRAHIESFCVRDGQGPRSLRNDFTAVLGFFRWMRGREMININLDFDLSAVLPRIEKKAKTIYSVDEISAIFAALEENKRWHKFIPFFALQAFLGLRHIEAQRLCWSNIDLGVERINLPSEIVKTGEEFTIYGNDIPETLFKWLRKYKDFPITHPGDDARARITACVGGWRVNALRHTFATMHMSLCGDAKKTATILRHHNQDRLWNNYLANRVPIDDARRYFEIVPK